MSIKRKVVAIIPVVTASGPNAAKPLSKVLALPLVEHVRRRACLALNPKDVYVSTGDLDVKSVVEDCNGQVIVSLQPRQRASDLVAQAIEHIPMDDHDILITILDHETIFLPEVISLLIKVMEQEPSLGCANLVSVIAHERDMADKDVIKLVINLKGDIMCFSRSPLPYRGVKHFSVLYSKTGFAAFTKGYFLKFMTLAPSPLEITEAIDFMRILEHGYSIKGVVYNRNIVRIHQKDHIPPAESVMRKEFDHNLVYQAILNM